MPAANARKLRRLASSLMLLSGITHVAQLAVYGTERSAVGASVFGCIYFAIGLLLLSRARIALILGVLLPSIGGVLGVYRFLHLHANPFSVFHVALDLVVVPICLYLYARRIPDSH
ncbi:MAG: hypothetical protein IT364_21895 [Candidatus Hydrogenedentes bacterium]|nr:hypothetical protein [Candidatus Hydrogenedentota bacterium]